MSRAKASEKGKAKPAKGRRVSGNPAKAGGAKPAAAAPVTEILLAKVAGPVTPRVPPIVLLFTTTRVPAVATPLMVALPVTPRFPPTVPLPVTPRLPTVLLPVTV